MFSYYFLFSVTSVETSALDEQTEVGLLLLVHAQAKLINTIHLLLAARNAELFCRAIRLSTCSNTPGP